MSNFITFGINKLEKLVNERTFKGKSTIEFYSNYVIIDIETTGLDTQFDEIIEIGALKIKDNIIVDRFNTLIKPEYEIGDFITELTGITNDMLINAPNIKDKIGEFINFIGEDILVGHNVNFDINFLYDNGIRTINKPIKNDYIDTMRISRLFLKELKHHRLSDMANYYNINVEKAHRSLYDCETTKMLYDSLIEDILKSYKSAEELYKKVRIRNNFKASDIKTENTEFDIENPFYNKVCVFTGTLEKMIRKEAMQMVADLGGICADNVTKDTNFLILGNNDYCPSIKNGKSNKQKKQKI